MSFLSRETSRNSGQPFELYLFTTAAGTYAYTSGDKERTFNGRTYNRLAISRSEADQGVESRAGGLTVTVPRSCDVAALFVSYIPESPLLLTVYQGHDGEAASEVLPLFDGSVVSAGFGEHCELKCAPENEIDKRRIPAQEFSSHCPWVLYSEGCGVDRAAFRVVGALTVVSGLTIKAAAFASKPDGWFRGGYAEMGAVRRLVVAHVGDTLTLSVAIAGAVVGSSVSAYAGCPHTTVACKTIFNNLKRRWGFDHIPNINPFGESGAF